MNTLKDVAVGGGVFRLPDVRLGLSHRGIAAIRQTIGGVRRRIITLTRVRDVGTQTGLQLQLRDDSPLGKASADDTSILRLRIVVQKVADGITHLAVVDIHTRRRRLIVEGAVSVVDRGVGRMRYSAIP